MCTPTKRCGAFDRVEDILVVVMASFDSADGRRVVVVKEWWVVRGVVVNEDVDLQSSS